MNDTCTKKENIFKRIGNSILDFFTRQFNKLGEAMKQPNSLFWYVFILFIVGVLFYAYSLFTQYWTTSFGGDYTQQQIPFFYNGYDDWWTFFKTGKFVMWDENTFLGGDNIGCNSFYYIFNPFFQITLLFPRNWIPQIMALESIIKVITAGLLMRKYLKYIGVSEISSRIFGVVYSVCGWVAFYFWFNTFADVAALLPLMLLGIEITIKERKPIVLVIGVMLEAVTNYFFLFSICLFGVGYALFRLIQTSKTRTTKENFKALGLGVVGFALGLGISAFAIIPGFLIALNSPRVSSTTVLEKLADNLKNVLDFQYLKNDYSGNPLKFLFRKIAWSYEKNDIVTLFKKTFYNWNISSNNYTYEYRKYYPLVSFLFPTMSCRYVTLIDINQEWNLGSSLFVFTPTVMMFICSIFESIRKKKISHLIAVAIFIFILFTPIFYSLFFGFSAQYGRWQIIAVICVVIYAAINYDKRKEMPRWFFPISVVITLLLMALAYYFVRVKIYGEIVNDEYNKDMDAMFIYAVLMCAAEGILFFCLRNKKNFEKVVLASIVIEATIMGNIAQNGQGIISYKNSVNGGLQNVINETYVVNKIKKYDNSYYRIYSTRQYQGNENIQMREGYNGVATFHSLYNYNTIDFIRMSHIFKSSNTWIGGIIEKRLNLDTFLGVKYYITKDSDTTVSYTSGNTKIINPNVPFDYEQIFTDEETYGYRVYENKSHIDLGFSYDTIYYKYAYDEDELNKDSYYNSFNNDGRSDMSIMAEESYLKGAILNNSDIKLIQEKYPSISYEHAPNRDAKKLSCYYDLVYLKQLFDPFNLSGLVYGNELDWKQQALVITPKSGTYFNTDEDGDYFILDLKLLRSSTNYNANVYLFDDAGNVITRDDHTNPGYTSGYKHLRGFYGKKVAKIIIVPKSGVVIPNKSPALYAEGYATYKERINEFNTYPLENVTRDVNKYGFTTDFTDERFIVLQLPYEKGWTVTAINNGHKEKLDYYNAQGGFVGFMSKTGTTKYVVSYKSVGFTPAVLISLTSFFLFGGLIAGGAVIEAKRKEKENAQAD